MLNKSEITSFTVHVNHLSIVKEWRFYLLHTLNHYVGITTEMFRTGICNWKMNSVLSRFFVCVRFYAKIVMGNN